MSNWTENWKGYMCSVCGKPSVAPDELHCLKHYPCLPEKFNDSIAEYITQLRNRIEELERNHTNCIPRSSLPELPCNMEADKLLQRINKAFGQYRPEHRWYEENYPLVEDIELMMRQKQLKPLCDESGCLNDAVCVSSSGRPHCNEHCWHYQCKRIEGGE